MKAKPIQWLTPKRASRICDRCGQHYSRRNLVEAWDTQNQGHRAGWQKTRLRICTKCGPASVARRTLMVVSIVPKARP